VFSTSQVILTLALISLFSCRKDMLKWMILKLWCNLVIKNIDRQTWLCLDVPSLCLLENMVRVTTCCQLTFLQKCLWNCHSRFSFHGTPSFLTVYVL
jgi:hypothetical protein